MFNPVYGSGVTVSPGTVSASSTIAKGNQSLCLTNLGSVVCYVRVTDAAAISRMMKGSERYLANKTGVTLA